MYIYLHPSINNKAGRVINPTKSRKRNSKKLEKKLINLEITQNRIVYKRKKRKGGSYREPKQNGDSNEWGHVGHLCFLVRFLEFSGQMATLIGFEMTKFSLTSLESLSSHSPLIMQPNLSYDCHDIDTS